MDVVVVGGGVIGLATGWRLALAGAAVSVIDRHTGQGASVAAAGMLAPVTGPSDAAPPLRDLGLAAAAAYPSFVEELEEAAGVEVGYRRCGTLSVATDPSGRGGLDRLAQQLGAAGIGCEWIDEDTARVLQPTLIAGTGKALWIDGDHQIDSARLVAALETACRRAGARLVPAAAASVRAAGGRATGVDLDDGTRLSAGAVVIACGCASATIPGVPPGSVPELTAVLGEVVHLQGPPARGDPVVRRHRDGPSTYVVPRHGGGYTVGATVRPGEAAGGATAGGVVELLQSALQVMPALARLPLSGTAVGVRTAAPDGVPVIGPTRTPGLLVSTGHFHKGILLAPLSADLIRGVLAGDQPLPLARTVAPDRFAVRTEWP